MVVSWATADDELAPSVSFWGPEDVELRTVNGSSQVYSQLLWYLGGLLHPALGAPSVTEVNVLSMQNTSGWAASYQLFPYGRTSSYSNPTALRSGLGHYKNPGMIYTSPLVCTATLASLLPGRTYGYRVAGHARNFSFTMPPDAASIDTYPFTLGLTADLGQTRVSQANVEVLRRQAEANAVHAVLLAGDLSYADGWFSRWDTYGRMMEPLAATVPVMTTGGNHEIGVGEQWVSYNARYPMPHKASGSPSNLWWSRDVGPVHVVSLCSYAATRPGSLQHRWLLRDLASVDRAKTPWLVVMMHAPWYNTNRGHRGEAELMRQHMEGPLYAAGADLVLSGHVHAYERTHNVFRGHLDECGPVYLNLGDGGNRESAYMPWYMPQPPWSAFRQSTFGVGLLTFHNATHAWYNWSRVACASLNASADHINFASDDCHSRSYHYDEDNAEDPYANQDGTWIVRSVAVRERCDARYNETEATSVAETTTSGGGAPPEPMNYREVDEEDTPSCAVDERSATTLVIGTALAAGLVGMVLGALGVRLLAERRKRHIVKQRGVILRELSFSNRVEGSTPAATGGPQPQA